MLQTINTWRILKDKRNFAVSTLPADGIVKCRNISRHSEEEVSVQYKIWKCYHIDECKEGVTPVR